MIRKTMSAVGTVLTVLLSAACSATVPGKASPDPDATAVRLDTGNFTTKPRTPETSNGQQRVLAANMLADKMSAPFDFDPTYLSGRARAIVAARNLTELDEADSARIGERDLLYGFTHRRFPNGSILQEGLAITLLRMADDAAAKSAVDDFRSHGGATEVIDGHPEVSARKTPPHELVKVTRFTAYTAIGPLLLIVEPWNLDENLARNRVTEVISAQRDRLSGFTSPGQGELAALPVDQDQIVSHTVAPPALEPRNFVGHYGFQTARTQLHWDDNPIDTGQLFEDTGVDLVGIGRNTVYRTSDAATAKQFVEDASKIWMSNRTDARHVTIDGLPTARCGSYETSTPANSALSICLVAVGRYVSEAVEDQALQATQVTSAGYLVLKEFQ